MKELIEFLQFITVREHWKHCNHSILFWQIAFVSFVISQQYRPDQVNMHSRPVGGYVRLAWKRCGLLRKWRKAYLMFKIIIALLGIIKRNPTFGLSIITIYLYLWTYGYEKGYLSAFNIDSSFIFVDFNVLLSDAENLLELIFSTAFFFLLIRYIIIGLLFKKFLKIQSQYTELALIFCRFVTFCLLSYVYSSIPNSWINYFLLLLLFTYIVIIPISFYRWPLPKSENQSTTNELSTFTISAPLEKYILICLMTLPLVLSNIFGEGVATKTRLFKIIKDTSNLVVIRKYGDQFVSKRLTKNNHFENGVYILKIHQRPLDLTDTVLNNFQLEKETYERSIVKKRVTLPVPKPTQVGNAKKVDSALQILNKKSNHK